MSTTTRFISALFTALPSFIFFILFLATSLIGRDYWWGTYFTVLIVLLLSSLWFGLSQPNIFQRVRIHHPWIWILIQGLFAWIVALIVLGLLNTTPLCVGQDNGDGNNDFGMCMFMTALSSVVYTPIYLMLLGASALIGHWVMKIFSSQREAE